MRDGPPEAIVDGGLNARKADDTVKPKTISENPPCPLRIADEVLHMFNDNYDEAWFMNHDKPDVKEFRGHGKDGRAGAGGPLWTSYVCSTSFGILSKARVYVSASVSMFVRLLSGGVVVCKQISPGAHGAIYAFWLGRSTARSTCHAAPRYPRLGPLCRVGFPHLHHRTPLQ